MTENESQQPFEINAAADMRQLNPQFIADKLASIDRLVDRLAFAELVRAWRYRRGITRAEAARRLKIPYRTLEYWENGEHAPRGMARRVMEARFRRR